MSKHTKEFIFESVEAENVEVIWHWFVDIDGYLKCFAITPHELSRSLEDGMAKRVFRAGKTAGTFRELTKRPVIADDVERAANPRSRSAKLRVAERMDA